MVVAFGAAVESCWNIPCWCGMCSIHCWFGIPLFGICRLRWIFHLPSNTVGRLSVLSFCLIFIVITLCLFSWCILCNYN
jgi:hypothetical protein